MLPIPTSPTPTPATPFLLLFSQDEYRADLRTILREELRQIVREELAARPGAPAAVGASLSGLLTVQEAAAFLGVCKASIHAWKRQGLLAYRKLGNRTVFTPEELLAAVQQPPSFDGRRTTPRRRGPR